LMKVKTSQSHCSEHLSETCLFGLSIWAQYFRKLPKAQCMQAQPKTRVAGNPARIPIVLTAGFRFFFLAAGLYAVFAMLVWIGWLGAQSQGDVLLTFPQRMMPYQWHAHEMIFGYTVAVMAGFFLTAVPNWTGTQEAKTVFVSLSGLLWLSGRIAVWFSGVLDPLLVAIVDLAFVPLLALNILPRLARKSQARNLVFLFLLTALFTANLLVHVEWMGWFSVTAEIGVRLGIFVSAGMIAIVGGRVVPAFTRNALSRLGQTENLPQSYPWLDRAGILTAMLAALASLPFVPAIVFGILCLAAGMLNLLRLVGWKGWLTIKTPILWILHLAFLLLAVGYLVYGSSLVIGGIGESTALHLLAIGAVGSMTLAMMTRASLGHSGRSLKASTPIVIAYLAVVLAALTRTFGTLVFDYFPVMFASGALWITAFSLFAVVYFPILTRKRKSR
jgi:uncharacterized protein involved in response to NO